MELEIVPIKSQDMEKEIQIYTDGHCKHNGSKSRDANGGWAFVVIENEEKIAHDYDSEEDTTNNRMEMMAIIKAMKYILNHYPVGANCIICTDSSYVANGVNEDWVGKWASNGWKTHLGTEVLNQDLWKELIAMQSRITCDIKRVHRGNPFTRLADKIARGNKDVDYWYKFFMNAEKKPKTEVLNIPF